MHSFVGGVYQNIMQQKSLKSKQHMETKRHNVLMHSAAH